MGALFGEEPAEPVSAAAEEPPERTFSEGIQALAERRRESGHALRHHHCFGWRRCRAKARRFLRSSDCSRLSSRTSRAHSSRWSFV